MEYKPCECPMAGYCERYRKNMDERDWKLCQTVERRRMLFDEMAGNADFGLWHTPAKGNVPKHIAKQVKLNVKQKTISREQAMGILEDNKKMMEVVKELEKNGITDKSDMEGLGDLVENVLTKFGITEKLVKKVIGRTCGCSKRKKFLNKLVPFTKK